MTKRVFKLVHSQARQGAERAVKEAPDGFVVTVAEPTRSLDANAAMWVVLQAFADQLQWPVNGAMVWMTADEWKDVLSAAYKRESVKVAMGMDGGMVMLGSRTSKFSVREMSEFIDFLHATAAARDVDVNYLEHA
jgi:class 3 adenylate cyclase